MTASPIACRDAIWTVETYANAKHILMPVSPDDYGDHIRFEADGRRLRQVFWNLLVNAVKFTPPGGLIRINIRRLDGMVQIDITDSGHGIEAEDLPHVFGAFRLQQHNNDTGLGLSRGQGATFAIQPSIVLG